MVEIESPLGRSTFNSGSRQVFTVPDGSETEQVHYEPQPKRMSAEDFKAYENMKREMATSQRKSTPEAKKRVEFLTGLGRLTDTFELDGIRFSIHTLKSKELREVAQTLINDQLKTVDLPFEIRDQVLARAIFAINDYEIEQIIGSNDIQDKIEYVSNFDDNAATYIYRKYQKLVEDGKEKYGLNNEADVKEVAEEVKKS